MNVTKATFYHAGCQICVDAEKMVLSYLDKSKVDIDVVHLGEEKSRVKEAKDLGVKSVPALVIDKQVYHINHGADINDV